MAIHPVITIMIVMTTLDSLYRFATYSQITKSQLHNIQDLVTVGAAALIVCAYSTISPLYIEPTVDDK